MIDVSTRTRGDLERLQELLPPWAVILHNDDVNSMDYVVRCLIKSVDGVSLERATEIMLEAHNQGRALVVTCPLERAELYRDRLASFSLTVTIEKA
jgi:ATP-dependent Clp protease adaptor protein ClpS